MSLQLRLEIITNFEIGFWVDFFLTSNERKSYKFSYLEGICKANGKEFVLCCERNCVNYWLYFQQYSQFRFSTEKDRAAKKCLHFNLNAEKSLNYYEKNSHIKKSTGTQKIFRIGIGFNEISAYAVFFNLFVMRLRFWWWDEMKKYLLGFCYVCNFIWSPLKLLRKNLVTSPLS